MRRQWTVRNALVTTMLAVTLTVSTSSVRCAPKVFAIFGDCGEGNKTDNQCTGWTADSDQLAVRNLMASWNSEFLLTMGDNIYFVSNQSGYTGIDATEAFDIAMGQYYSNFIRFPSGSASCFTAVQASLNRFFPSAGNHDWDWDLNNSLAAYTGYFNLPGSDIAVGSVSSGNERYYDFIQGDAHFFVISSDGRETHGVLAPAETDGSTTPTNTQPAWLKQALAASTAPWKFVYFHHPPYGSAGTSSGLRWPFQLWGADAVFVGHAHVYERVMHQASASNPRIPFITSGLGGRNLHTFGTLDGDSVSRFNTEFGAIRAEVSATTASFVFYTAGGRMVDSLYLVKNGGGGTVDSKVSANSDDAEENTAGAVDIGSSDLELVDDIGDWGANQRVGMRFLNIGVPRHAIIKKAYVQFSVKDNTSGTDNLTIRGQAADNPVTFVASTTNSPNFNVSGRTTTTASVAWSPNAWTLGTSNCPAGPDQQTPDLTNIIQEIVNRSGWNISNAMVILVSGSSGVRRAWSHNGRAAEAPRLHVEWEVPTVSIVANDSTGSETCTDPGVFTVTRSGGNLTPALTVNYSISGTAVNGSDYSTLSGSVTIGSGATTATITVTPISATPGESAETVILTLTTNIAYVIASPNSATVTITESDAYDWEPQDDGIGGRVAHSTVFTGTDVIVWGGGIDGVFLDDGGRFNLAGGTWTALATSNAPAGRWWHAAVWTGTEMIIWGGRPAFFSESHFHDGAAYNPATDTWRSISTNGAPTGRSQLAVVWTGTRMIVWGGHSDGMDERADGAAYHPSTDTWTALASTSLAGRVEPSAVWTGTEMIVFGGLKVDNYLGDEVWTSFGDGARYNPTTDSWSTLNSSGAPSTRTAHTGVWTGTEMLIWGGRDLPDYNFLNTGARYNPATDTWTAITSTGVPDARVAHAAVWTGTRMIVWGGYVDVWGTPTDTGGEYSPSCNTWTATASTDAPSARFFAGPNDSAIWTPYGMFIHGGWEYPYSLNSTALYRRTP